MPAAGRATADVKSLGPLAAGMQHNCMLNPLLLQTLPSLAAPEQLCKGYLLPWCTALNKGLAAQKQVQLWLYSLPCHAASQHPAALAAFSNMVSGNTALLGSLMHDATALLPAPGLQCPAVGNAGWLRCLLVGSAAPPRHASQRR